MRKTVLSIGSISLFTLFVFLAACGSEPKPTADSPIQGKVIKSGPAGNNLTATISNADGMLKKGQQEFMLAFTDTSGKAVDVGSVALNYRMAAMGSMGEMNNGATFTTTGTPGVYKGKANLEMAGEWQAQITYEGPAGKSAFSLLVTAK
jgi:YtkA-like